MRRRASHLVALTTALVLAHCAWVTPGVGIEVAVHADDAPGPVLDAQGAPHTLQRAVLRVESIAFLPCPDASALTRRGDATPAFGIGPGRARAHEEEASLGPFELDLLAPTPRMLGRLEQLPGEYCDVRISVAPADHAPSLRVEGDTLAVTSELTQERVARISRVALTAENRDATVTLAVSVADVLRRIDPASPDEVADGAAALAAVLRALRVE